jgi:hypothetical protein
MAGMRMCFFISRPEVKIENDLSLNLATFRLISPVLCISMAFAGPYFVQLLVKLRMVSAIGLPERLHPEK